MLPKYNVKSRELETIQKQCYKLEQYVFKGNINNAINICNEIIGICQNIISDIKDGN